MNFKLTIQYDGTRYDGWQKQGNTDNTIQGKLESVLSRLAERPVEVHGAGRTDAGVHAEGQTASVRLPDRFSSGEVLEYLNRYLPEDIAVLTVEEADDRFHARLSATGKVYRYAVRTGGVPGRTRQTTLLGPPAVSVHYHSTVRGENGKVFFVHIRFPLFLLL